MIQISRTEPKDNLNTSTDEIIKDLTIQVENLTKQVEDITNEVANLKVLLQVEPLN